MFIPFDAVTSLEVWECQGPGLLVNFLRLTNMALSTVHPNPTAQAASSSLKNSWAQKLSAVNILLDVDATDFI